MLGSFCCKIEDSVRSETGKQCAVHECVVETHLFLLDDETHLCVHCTQVIDILSVCSANYCLKVGNRDPL